MANQKEFKIIINGVEESIKQIDVLNAQLTNLEKRIDALSHKKIEITSKIDAGTMPSVDTASTANLKEQIELAKELKQLHKDIASGAKDENGNYTNTLKGLRKQLADMKKELSGMELGTSEWAEMSSKVNDVNTQVKELEKSFGVFNRQVGNYEIVAQGMSKLKLSVGGVTKEFNSAKEASKTLENEMKSLAAQMYELETTGQKGTDAYKQLEQQFNELAQAGDQLSHIADYSDRLKQSIQDDSGAIGELARTVDSFSNVVQIGVGVMGLFGETSEDTQKALNRTVQTLTVLKGVQEFVNNDLQKGAPLVKLYESAVNGLSSAFIKQGAASTTASVAVNVFSKALVATGIGAIVVAIGYLIANFDELSEILGISSEQSEEFGKIWDKTKEIFMGVGNVIVQYLLTPFRELYHLVTGDFDALLDDVKNGLNVVENYKAGANKQAEKNTKERYKKEQTEREKDLKRQIEVNEAKYGSDWKYTEDAKRLYAAMFEARLAMYDEDSDEYHQAQVAKLNYDRDLLNHQNKSAEDARNKAKAAYDKRVSDAKQYASKVKSINEKIEDNKLEAMKDGFKKQMAQLAVQEKREIQAAKESGIKVQEQLNAINEKYGRKRMEMEQQHFKSIQDMYSSQLSQLNKNINDSFTSIQNNMIKSIDNIMNTAISNASKIQSPLDKIAGKDSVEVLKHNLDQANTEIANFVHGIKALEGKRGNLLLNINAKEYSESFKALGETMKSNIEKIRKEQGGLSEEIDTIIDKLDDFYKRLNSVEDYNVETGFGGVTSNRFKIFIREIEKAQEEVRTLSKEAEDSGNNNYQNVTKEYRKFVELFLKMQKEFIAKQQKLEQDNSNAVNKKVKDRYEKMKEIISQELKEIQEIQQKYGLVFGDENPFITNKMVDEVKKDFERLGKTIESELKYIQNSIDKEMEKVRGNFKTIPTNQDDVDRVKAENAAKKQAYEEEVAARQKIVDTLTKADKSEQDAKKKQRDAEIKAAKEENERRLANYKAQLKARQDIIDASLAARNAEQASAKKQRDEEIKVAKEENERRLKEYEEQVAARQKMIDAAIAARNAEQASAKKASDEAIANAKAENDARQKAYDEQVKAREKAIAKAKAEVQAENEANEAKKKASQEAIANAKAENDARQKAYELAVKAREDAIKQNKAEVDAENEANEAKKKAREEEIKAVKAENDASQKAYENAVKERDIQNERNAKIREYIDLLKTWAGYNKMMYAAWDADNDATLAQNQNNIRKNYLSAKSSEALDKEIASSNDIRFEGGMPVITDSMAEQMVEKYRKLANDMKKEFEKVGDDISKSISFTTPLEELNALIDKFKDLPKVTEPTLKQVPTPFNYTKKDYSTPSDISKPQMVEIPVEYKYDEKSFELPPEVKKPDMVDIPVAYKYDTSSFELPPEVKKPDMVDIPVEYKYDDSSFELPPEVEKPQMVEIPVEYKYDASSFELPPEIKEPQYIKLEIENSEEIFSDVESLNRMINSINSAFNGGTKKKQIDGEYGDIYSMAANINMPNDPTAFDDVYKLLKTQNVELAESFKNNGGEITDEIKEVLIPVLEELYAASEQILDLRSIEDQMQQAKDEVDKGAEDMTKAWMLQAKKMLETVAPYASSALTAINNAVDVIFDNANKKLEDEIDEIDDRLDELSDAYDREEELEEKHKDKMQSIEDELATARGDRRTALLDQLNQEVAARERAFQNEQKIQKQQEALNKRKEQLQKQEDENERKRNQAKKVTSIIQATINTALGVTQALGAYPPPASYVFAAIVGALGAAEIATIAAQKYANGGVIEGKSHNQGGVKVLGGQAEVEGGEFITNKRTTAKNVGLLEYINSQDKQLTLKDVAEYFGGKKPNFAQTLNQTRFANGGKLSVPNLPTNQIQKMVITDNRPVVVSVVDIIEETNNLRNIQVLAGENPNF